MIKILIINDAIEAIRLSLDKQQYSDKNYRRFLYTHFVEVENGLLIYNVLTREFIFLDNDEKRHFLSLNFSESFMKELVEKYFFVPVDNDDYLVYRRAHGIFRLLGNRFKNPPLTDYTIFTTTDCNARCFYCYELNSKRISMTEKTAEDLAEYIFINSRGNKVNLLWFGGEPLLNYKVIDIITSSLKKRGVAFQSKMISNAYLFDDKLIEKAKNDWNLKWIQITLDGTEAVYNRIKSYIYTDTKNSPFIKVLNNIDELLEKKIFVSIRINVDMHNYNDIYELIKQLNERYSKYNAYCAIYFSLLFDNCGKMATERTPEVKKFLYKKVNEFRKMTYDTGLFRKRYLSSARKVNHCMADSDSSTTVLPDGHLGKCEHYIDNYHYGSIYSESKDYAMIEDFKTEITYNNNCPACPLQPRCHVLKYCNHFKQECDSFERKSRFGVIEEEMKNEYNKFIKTIESDSFGDDDFCS